MNSNIRKQCTFINISQFEKIACNLIGSRQHLQSRLDLLLFPSCFSPKVGSSCLNLTTPTMQIMLVTTKLDIYYQVKDLNIPSGNLL